MSKFTAQERENGVQPDFWQEAVVLRRLMTQRKLTQREAARQLGISQSTLCNKMRILRLPQSVIRQLRAGGYSERHARIFLRLTQAEQRKVLLYLSEQYRTVAQTEEFVEQLIRQRDVSRETEMMPATTEK